MSSDETPSEPTLAVVSSATPAPTPTEVPTEALAANDTSTEPPNEHEELAVEEEALPPSLVHPSAAAGTTEDSDLKAGREKYGQYFIGMWYHLPNFGCPYCAYSTIDSNGDVELHTLSMIDSGDLRHMAALNLEGA